MRVKTEMAGSKCIGCCIVKKVWITETGGVTWSVAEDFDGHWGNLGMKTASDLIQQT